MLVQVKSEACVLREESMSLIKFRRHSNRVFRCVDKLQSHLLGQRSEGKIRIGTSIQRLMQQYVISLLELYDIFK
jgi:hypothetical protein